MLATSAMGAGCRSADFVAAEGVFLSAYVTTEKLFPSNRCTACPRRPAFFYRLVVYGDGRTYPPSEFESLDPLLKALHSVLPDFDESTFPYEGTFKTRTSSSAKRYD